MTLNSSNIFINSLAKPSRNTKDLCAPPFLFLLIFVIFFSPEQEELTVLFFSNYSKIADDKM